MESLSGSVRDFPISTIYYALLGYGSLSSTSQNTTMDRYTSNHRLHSNTAVSNAALIPCRKQYWCGHPNLNHNPSQRAALVLNVVTFSLVVAITREDTRIVAHQGPLLEQMTGGRWQEGCCM